MDLTIHVHHHIDFGERRSPLDDVLAALGEIKTVLHTSFAKAHTMAQALDDKLALIEGDVTNLTSKISAAVAELDTAKADLKTARDNLAANGVSDAELAEVDSIHSKLSALSDTLTAPADPAPAPTSDPTPAPPADTGTGGTATGGTDTGATPPTTDPTGGAGGDGTVPTPVVDDGSTPTS
jgi:hypothetical protein